MAKKKATKAAGKKTAKKKVTKKATKKKAVKKVAGENTFPEAEEYSGVLADIMDYIYEEDPDATLADVRTEIEDVLLGGLVALQEKHSEDAELSDLR